MVDTSVVARYHYSLPRVKGGNSNVHNEYYYGHELRIITKIREVAPDIGIVVESQAWSVFGENGSIIGQDDLLTEDIDYRKEDYTLRTILIKVPFTSFDANDCRKDMFLKISDLIYKGDEKTLNICHRLKRAYDRVCLDERYRLLDGENRYCGDEILMRIREEFAKVLHEYDDIVLQMLLAIFIYRHKYNIFGGVG